MQIAKPLPVHIRYKAPYLSDVDEHEHEVQVSIHAQGCHDTCDSESVIAIAPPAASAAVTGPGPSNSSKCEFTARPGLLCFAYFLFLLFLLLLYCFCYLLVAILGYTLGWWELITPGQTTRQILSRYIPVCSCQQPLTFVFAMDSLTVCTPVRGGVASHRELGLDSRRAG